MDGDVLTQAVAAANHPAAGQKDRRSFHPLLGWNGDSIEKLKTEGKASAV